MARERDASTLSTRKLESSSRSLTSSRRSERPFTSGLTSSRRRLETREDGELLSKPGILLSEEEDDGDTFDQYYNDRRSQEVESSWPRASDDFKGSPIHRQEIKSPPTSRQGRRAGKSKDKGSKSKKPKSKSVPQKQSKSKGGSIADEALETAIPFSEWEEHIAPDGRKYYYNKSIGQSLWEKPAELVDVELVREGSAWKEHTAPDGRKYYYNRHTKESKWIKPKAMIDGEEALERLNGGKAQPPHTPKGNPPGSSETPATEAPTSTDLVLAESSANGSATSKKDSKKKAKTGTTRSTCELCEYALANLHCLQCDENFCEECMNFSHRKGAKTTHTYRKLIAEIRPFTELSVEELASWTAQFDALRKYIPQFLSLPVDGYILSECKEEDLEELGISVPLHRKKILFEMEKAKCSGVDIESLDEFDPVIHLRTPSSLLQNYSQQAQQQISASPDKSSSSKTSSTTLNASSQNVQGSPVPSTALPTATTSTTPTWIRYTDRSSGKYYYYNSQTKETKWEIEAGAAFSNGDNVSASISTSTSGQSIGTPAIADSVLLHRASELYQKGLITEEEKGWLKEMVMRQNKNVINALSRNDVPSLREELKKGRGSDQLSSSDTDWDSD